MEYGDQLVFMHAVKQGPANRSFGLHVAALAGLPRGVIQQARLYLENLENRTSASVIFTGEKNKQRQQSPQLSLFTSLSPVEETLASINPDELSPKEALEILYKLCKIKQSCL